MREMLKEIKVVEKTETKKQPCVNLKNRVNLNYQTLEQKLLGMFDDNASKAFIMNFFKSNKNQLVNLDPNTISELVQDKINNYH
ncbi:hypothetical protein [Spiroplasma poulsonii]|uniref:hypothetical protein n=1 Tax=Spiroplasma poulsonii TaxID=2138 RepID=UPI001F4CDFC2|nr:hypothetical protein [Spiroplasma poulsonii]UNF61195.1 hypothetical protein MNU24_04575 [Spiroplasma poulsonii]